MPENLDFGLNLEKIAILVKIFENLNFGEDFRNISILIKIFENLNFGQNFRSISILVKFSKNLKICETFEKSGWSQNFRIKQYWSKSLKVSILVKIHKNVRFWSKFAKKNLNLCRTFEKSGFSSTYSRNSDFGQNPSKSRFLRSLSKYLDWWKFLKISVLDKIFAILVKICEISSLVKFFDKSRLIRNISLLIQISNNLDFGQFFLRSWLKWKFSKYLDFGQNRQK